MDEIRKQVQALRYAAKTYDLGIGLDAKGYPATIDVVMSDGETVRYKKG